MAEEGLCALLENGDISECQKSAFISAVKAVWVAVHGYATSRLPHGDEVLMNSQWIDFFRRQKAKFTSVKFFLNRFPVVSLSPTEIDSLRDEFDDYKTLTDDEVCIESCSVDIEYMEIKLQRKTIEWTKFGQILQICSCQ